MRSNNKKKIISRAFAMLLSVVMIAMTIAPSGVLATEPSSGEETTSESVVLTDEVLGSEDSVAIESTSMTESVDEMSGSVPTATEIDIQIETDAEPETETEVESELVEEETLVSEEETVVETNVQETEPEVRYGTYFEYVENDDDNNTVLTVKVECNEAAMIPETAILHADRLDPMDDGAKFAPAYKAVADKLNLADDETLIYVPYDIYFTDVDGERIDLQPCTMKFIVKFHDAPINVADDTEIVSAFIASVDEDGEVEFLENEKDRYAEQADSEQTEFEFECSVKDVIAIGPAQVQRTVIQETEEPVEETIVVEDASTETEESAVEETTVEETPVQETTVEEQSETEPSTEGEVDVESETDVRTEETQPVVETDVDVPGTYVDAMINGVAVKVRLIEHQSTAYNFGDNEDIIKHDTEVIDAIQEYIGKSREIYSVYDINGTVDGICHVVLNGVNIPEDAELLHFAEGWKDDADKIETLEYLYNAEKQTVSFNTESFSPFAFVEKAEEIVEEPSEEEVSDETATDGLVFKTLYDLGKTHAITVSGMMPEDAVLDVTQLEAEPFDNLSDGKAVAAFDISIISNGEKYQPETFGCSVTIRVKNLDGVPEGAEMSALHVKADADAFDNEDALVAAVDAGNVETESVDVTVTEESAVLEAESFSVYVFYTVEFVYDGYEYVLQGDDSVNLSDLLVALNIASEDTVAEFISHIQNVEFSNGELVDVSSTESGWVLKALKAFDTTETLTLIMDDGTKYEIVVTDDNETSVSIGKFSATLLTNRTDNLVDEEGTYYLRPRVNGTAYSSLKNVTKIYYQLQFTLNGQDGEVSAAANAVELRIPAHIFYYRLIEGTLWANNSNVGIGSRCTLPIPKAPATGDLSFNYSYDEETDEYVITNYEALVGTKEVVMTFEYMVPTASFVVDGSIGNFNATAKVNLADGTLLTGETSAEPVIWDTSVDILSSGKAHQVFLDKYPTVDDNKGYWGEVPADADDYYYGIWAVEGKIDGGGTQPYSLTFEDIPGDTDGNNSVNGEVVGYNASSLHLQTGSTWNSTFLNARKGAYVSSDESAWHPGAVWNIPAGDRLLPYHIMETASDGMRYREYNVQAYVLVRYPKSQLVDGTTVSNSIKITVEGYDDHIVKSETGTKSVVFHDLQFVAPIGTLANIEKKGWDQYSPDKWAIGMIEQGIDYSFVKGGGTGTSSNKYFENRMTVQNYAATLREDGDPNNIDDYGVNPIHSELIDDLFFLGGDFTQELSAEDYEIEYIYPNSYLGITVYDPELSFDGTEWRTKKVDSSLYPQVTISIQLNGEAQWHELGVIHPENTPESGNRFIPSDEYPDVYLEIHPQYAMYSNGLMNLPHNITGVKFETDSAYYRTYFDYYVGVKLKPSARVQSLLQDANGEYLDSSTLTDVNTARVFDSEGNDLFTGSGQTSSTERVMAHDIERYGQTLYHQTANGYLGKTSPSGYTYKQTYTSNDVANTRVLVNTTLYGTERISGIKGVYTPDEMVEMGAILPQETGVFYDLLPLGVEPIVSTIKAYQEDGYAWYGSSSSRWYSGSLSAAADFEYEVIHDFRNTGRTMLIVRCAVKDGKRTYTPNTVSGNAADYVGSGFKVSFQSSYSWASLSDYGTVLKNICAYETGNAVLAGGYPDDGYKSYKSDGTLANWYYPELEDLDPDTDAKRFKYASTTNNLAYVTAAESGLSKMVLTPSVEQWTAGKDGSAVVGMGENYQYRLRFGVDTNAEAKNIVLYDSFENYVPSGYTGSTFHGVFQGLDLTQPQGLGAAPVVYYSTVDNLQLDTDANRDISNSSIWSTTAPDDLSEVKAIAIDLRKAPNGEDFVLAEEQSVTVLVRMKAPEGATFVDKYLEDAHAYNSVWMSNIIVSSDHLETPFDVHYDYTQIGLAKPKGNISIDVEKYDGDTHTLLPGAKLKIIDSSDKVRVSWTSSDVAKTVSLPRGDTYRLVEETAPDGYAIADPITFTIDLYGVVHLIDGESDIVITKLTLDNFELPKTVDVSFEKRDGNTMNFLPGAVLQVLDADGEVVEEWTSESEAHTVTLGRDATYTVHEVSAPDGYSRCADFTISIDADGVITRKGETVDVVVIKNYEGIALPNTGSTSSIILMIVGAIVIVGGGLYFMLSRKKEEAED